MATRTVNIPGIARFARLDVPDEKYGTYQVTIQPTDKGWQVFEETGSTLKKRKDKTGKDYLVFRRKQDQTDFDGIALGPVNVFDKERAKVDKVFDGAKIVCNVDFYTTKAGMKGHRLNFVVVHENGQPFNRADVEDDAYDEEEFNV